MFRIFPTALLCIALAAIEGCASGRTEPTLAQAERDQVANADKANPPRSASSPKARESATTTPSHEQRAPEKSIALRDRALPTTAGPHTPNRPATNTAQGVTDGGGRGLKAQRMRNKRGSGGLAPKGLSSLIVGTATRGSRPKRRVSLHKQNEASFSRIFVGASPRGAPQDRANIDAPKQRAPRASRFVHAGSNPFVETRTDRLSTFAVDVDTASYTFARRFLERGQPPHVGSVRVEEWVNAFRYSYQQPESSLPFSIDMQAGPSPLDHRRHLLRVGIQGKTVSARHRKPVHLTFLVDTSGSMRASDKLPLAQRALHHLVDNLSAKDSVALITYAGSTMEVLPQTSAQHKDRIHRAINALRSGGGTAMGSGLQMAYRNAGKVVAPGSVSRVIVLSDGDANIGHTRHQDILHAVKGYVSEGITLSTVGFGTGNYQDHLMEQLANAGDGNYSYIDSFAAAKRVFGRDLSGTLQVIAKDVKIQVDMNPKQVKRYRLLGYENRKVADRDFRNDKVDAGEIGAGHRVTALYEVELVDPTATMHHDLATVRVRYKKPRGHRATEVARTLARSEVHQRFGDLDRDTRWAAAVSLAAEIFRQSPFARDKSVEDAWALAAEAAEGPYAEERKAFVDLLARQRHQPAIAVR